MVQARFVGLAHFAIGYVLTYGPFIHYFIEVFLVGMPAANPCGSLLQPRAYDFPG